MDELNDLMPISPDLNRERLVTLKQLFPDLFTNEGKLNPDELKKLIAGDLGSESERYEFRWHGKSASKRMAFTPSRAALVYDPARSVNPDKAGGNMIIEGENLEVLKLLTSSYRERIKCIYIDPPYNTGKDFVYADNFAKDKKAYWEETGTTEEGVKVDTNSESGGRYHSDWLSMIHSRLLISRQLLREDGVIFVSIDDNEVHNLRRLMDEVFGEENFIECIVWKKRYGGGAKEKHLVSLHEYVLFYAKNIDSIDEIYIPLTEESIERYYKLKDEKYEIRGAYRTHPLEATKSMGDRPNLVFPVPAPDGSEIMPKRQWLWGKDRVESAVANNELEFLRDRDGGWSVHTKQYLKDESGEIRQGKAFSIIDNVFTQHGTNEIIDLFGNAQTFSFPKPTKFIRSLIEMVLENQDDIVLDFFAGSGSTGQAVLDLNRSDGGSRRFILNQLPEAIKSTEEAYKSGFKKISDITIERVKRVISGREGELPFDEAGFKVYKLTKSSFPRVEFAPDPDKSSEENVELLKEYIKEKETAFHIAFEKEKIFDEVLLKNGFMLDYVLTQQTQFTGNEVYLVKDTYREALLCLDIPIDLSTVDYFKEHKEQRFICLEQALDTTRKWNLKHHLGDKFVAF